MESVLYTEAIHSVSHKNISIVRMQLDHVYSQDKILFNTNNHWENNEEPKDYREVLARSRTCNWIDQFHSNYGKITLDPEDLNWMKKAARIGMVTGKFSTLYEDELESICKKYEEQWKILNEMENIKGDDFQGWFVRSDRVSLKEGQHGIGPYKDFKNVIESAVSCGSGHSFFDSNDLECNIYLLPWLNLNPTKEFRIFVYKNEITAISDQHLYTINEYFNKLSDEEIQIIINKILDFFKNNIKNKLLYLENYTMDLALIEPNDIPYFVEPNSFGKLYAAGSALFSWIYDTDTLHDSSSIEFRYCHEY
jgi:hypothetical protein